MLINVGVNVVHAEFWELYLSIISRERFAADLEFRIPNSDLQDFSEILVGPSANNCTFTCKIERGEKGIGFAVSTSLACTLRFGGILEPPRSS